MRIPNANLNAGLSAVFSRLVSFHCSMLALAKAWSRLLQHCVSQSVFCKHPKCFSVDAGQQLLEVTPQRSCVVTMFQFISQTEGSQLHREGRSDADLCLPRQYPGKLQIKFQFILFEVLR